ncbi:universal stress protein [Paractinoplanes hotanensis]|uniref:Universal stress protein n=1 Tax=Paractinoplanes hotanensis TaxID=2906497 RepID=A0ABT0YFL8_9ACTN|nr:universal stress protein [Actinoplanes hotanensis]MCM4084836.1 universal stress protein [Actinoplanes hotanensis]
MRTHPIIVAADGTEPSKAAVRWAAREAFRRGRPLRVAHVFDWEWREARYDMSNQYLDIARKHAEGLTANAVYEARTAALKVEVEGDPLIGQVAPRLIGESDHAELMVLGNRGRGGFASLLLGSVSHRVATHASCSVVVVRGRGGDLAEGPIVVGVDDSPASDRVLEVAFDEAAGRGAALLAVRAQVPVEFHDPERAHVEEQLAPWRNKYPAVPVKVVLTSGGAAAELTAASATAQLVVVGSRGHGLIIGTALGSTGLQLLHHADCPVYVVREPRSES